jgi:biopolymer transport protein ExbD
MFLIDLPRNRRRPSLTPMIDVVFLLLVFFMLASRFGADAVVPLRLAGPGDGYAGPPRLVDVTPDGQRLNGVAQSLDAVVTGLEGMMESSDDIVILRAREGADLQRMMTVITALRAAGFMALAVVE